MTPAIWLFVIGFLRMALLIGALWVLTFEPGGRVLARKTTIVLLGLLIAFGIVSLSLVLNYFPKGLGS